MGEVGHRNHVFIDCVLSSFLVQPLTLLPFTMVVTTLLFHGLSAIIDRIHRNVDSKEIPLSYMMFFSGACRLMRESNTLSHRAYFLRFLVKCASSFVSFL